MRGIGQPSSGVGFGCRQVLELVVNDRLPHANGQSVEHGLQSRAALQTRSPRCDAKPPTVRIGRMCTRAIAASADRGPFGVRGPGRLEDVRLRHHISIQIGGSEFYECGTGLAVTATWSVRQKRLCGSAGRWRGCPRRYARRALAFFAVTLRHRRKMRFSRIICYTLHRHSAMIPPVDRCFFASRPSIRCLQVSVDRRVAPVIAGPGSSTDQSVCLATLKTSSTMSSRLWVRSQPG